MMTTKQVVYIVDDDESVRTGMARLMRSAGIEPRMFASAYEFEEAAPPEENACLIVDIHMPGKSGMDLWRDLIAKGSTLPVIFITAYDTAETRAEAKQAGGAGFFLKPVDDQALLDAIRWELSR